jgi:hypothetical protein
MHKLHSTFKSVATKAIGLSGAVTAACMTLAAMPAQAINLNVQPGDFTFLQGVGNNNAPGNSTIDNTAPTSGFGDVFDDAAGNTFLLLGANPGDLADDGNNNAGQTIAQYTFTLDNASDPLRISFDWAFEGNSTGNAASLDTDNFGIRLIGLASPVLLTRAVTDPDDGNGYGSGSESFTISPSQLTAGNNYTLRIILNENFDDFNNNSAAGFDNITIESVPFGFSTNASLIVFGTAFYGINRMRKKMAAKKLEM